MAFCGFARGAAMYDSTPIENMFLTEYLPAAPESFVKVYLYTRMLALHPELDAALGDVAKALRLDEDAVLDAMAYWEQQGLARKIADQPAEYELLSALGSSVSDMDHDYYQFRDFHADLQAMFPDKPLHGKEFEAAKDWIGILHFSQDAVLLAVKHEISQSRVKPEDKSPNPASLFKRLDKKMAAWAERGLITAAALERELRFSETVRATARQVNDSFSLRRLPTENELMTVRRWLEEWGYTPEGVLEICAMEKSPSNPNIRWLNAVLESRLTESPEAHGELNDILKELRGPGDLPSPTEKARYAHFRQQGFEAGTIRLAAVQCHRKRKTRFEDLEWMLEEWQKLGLFTRDVAEKYVSDMGRRRARMREILTLCGLERGVRIDDLALLEAWEAKLPDAVIDYAAACARGMHKPTLYMDRLIAGWAAEGIQTVEAARASHEARAAAAKPAGRAAQQNPALDYQQRSYTDADDEGLFVNLKEYLDEEGDGA